MMMLKAAVCAGVALAMLAPAADAACANGCSGHGTCGNFDQCTCQEGFGGNDCAARLCPHHVAWATTPQGDLNADGDRYDAAIYDTLNAFTTRDKVINDAHPGGTWETWPQDSVAGEGHHVMECSNAGICNTETGECQCYEGYEGFACNRMTCPNDCGQNGRCMSISEQVDESNHYTAGSLAYNLWDSDMIRSCKCDPGYSGNACQLRMCPKGDDPMTKTHQVDSVQVIRIQDSDVTAYATGGHLGGSFTLEFESKYGHRFTTADILLSPYTPGESGVSAGVDHSTAVATKAALEALPEKVIPDVTVTAGYCEKTLPGSYTNDFTANADGTDPGSGFLRCPGLTNTDCADVIVAFGGGGDVWRAPGGTGCGQTDASAASITMTPANVAGCTHITTPRCIELRVKFSDPANSGSQNLLKVDISKVTLGGYTNAQRDHTNTGTPTITSSVDDNVALSATDTFTVHRAADAVEISDAGATYATKTITLSGGILTGSAQILPANAKVAIRCQKAGSGTIYNMGDYTIDTTNANVASGGTIVLQEDVVDYQSRCFTGTNKVFILRKTDIAATEIDYQYTGIVTEGYALNLGGTLGTNDIPSAVSHTTFATDATTAVGFLLLTNNIAATPTGTVLYIDGRGTKEQSTCADRGVCDDETGLCKCFRGYTGEACNLQNALYVGDGN